MDDKLERACAKLPLRVLLEQYGYAPRGGNWSQMECPFCSKGEGRARKKAGLFTSNGKELFKCFSTNCPTGTVALDEVGIVAQVHQLSRKEAFIEYLKMAGVWKDQERLPPSVMPGKKGRKKPLPILNEFSPPPAPSGAGESGGEAAPGDNPNPTPGAAESPISTATSEDSASEGDVDRTHPEPDEPETELMETAMVPPGDEDRHDSPPASQSPFEDATSSDGHSHEGGESSGGQGTGGGEGDSAEGSHEDTKTRSGEGEEGEEGQGSGEQGAGNGEEGESPEAKLYRQVTEALIEFYSHLTLTPEDRESIRLKRGLSDEVIEWCGVRSSKREMEQVLVELRSRYEDEVLLKAGLYSQKENEHGEAVGPARPEPQLFGLGRVGKDEWGWTFPLLIPYFDSNGRLVHIRAHKGQTAGGTPRLFMVRRSGRRAPQKRTLVLTEGELKALAIVDGLDGAVMAGALPGISMAKHWKVWGDIQTVIAEGKVDEVVVVYDNEEKGDKSLPSFKADVTKRHDAEIWARYLAERCQALVRVAKVGRLPKEWRDEKGKADWDGALAKLRASGADVAAAFKQVLRDAIPVRELHQAGLFDASTEQFIHASVRKLFHVRGLPIGGSAELKVAGHFKEAAAAADGDYLLQRNLQELAAAYRSVLGRYYELKPPSEKMSTKWLARIKAAKQKMNWRLLRGCQKALEGEPVPVSDFLVEPLFTMEAETGLKERAVCLRNVHGERSRVVSWDSKSMSSPKDFRVWLLGKGGFGWSGNERNIQALVEDINVDLAFRTVRRVSCYGWDPASRLWFFRKAALGQEADGTALTLLPDENGVFWHNGVGYLLGDTGPSGQEFRQGHPDISPGLTLSTDAKLDLTRFKYGLDLVKAPATEQELMGCFLREVTGRMNEVFGGSEGSASVAWSLAFAAAPELFDSFKAFPLLFLHGAMGSGKTTVMSWLMELHGFRSMASGLGLKSSATAVGLQILLEQYSNLAAWGDEYEHDGVIDPKIQGTIHSNFNRELNSRWSADGAMRKVRTAMAITGEATVGRAATKSRFISFQVAKQKRSGTEADQLANFGWLEEHRKWFFVFFRHLIWNRDAYSSRLRHYLDEWRRSDDLGGLPERERFVFGVVYASFMALVEMFESHSAEDVARLKLMMAQLCVSSSVQVQSQVNTSAFWQDMCSAFQGDVFGTGSELKKYFHVSYEAMEYPPMAPAQGYWKSYKLYVNYNAVIAAMRAWLRKQGRDLILQAGDYASQMSRLPYWVPPKNPKECGHRQRFGSKTSVNSCWCIMLDRHELGYRVVPDEQLREAQVDAHGVASLEYADPRKGELYGIVEALERADG